jgi:hypothetical protein
VKRRNFQKLGSGLPETRELPVVTGRCEKCGGRYHFTKDHDRCEQLFMKAVAIRTSIGLFALDVDSQVRA